MDGVNRTLYIPLYGKALVSKMGLFYRDTWAEQIWDKEGFPLKGKAKSKWLAYNMAMRAAVFDHWVEEQLAQQPEAAVVHLGCGLDSRARRIGIHRGGWYDLDFPQVIHERRKYFRETEHYRMLSGDARQEDWLGEIPEGDAAIVVMEGIAMYLQPEALQQLLVRLCSHFSRVSVLMDVYTPFAARATKYKNPINEVGVTEVYGLESPEVLTASTPLRFLGEHDLTPRYLIARLPRREQGFFRMLFGGKTAKKIYRLYEFAGSRENLSEMD